MPVTTVATLAQPLILPMQVGAPVALALVGRPSFIAGVYVAIDAALSDPVIAKVLPSPPGTSLVSITSFGAAAAGSTILAGAAVCVTGPPGPQGGPGGIGIGVPGFAGPPGPSGQSLVYTTAPVTIPRVGQTVVVPVTNGAAYPNGATALFSDNTYAFIGTVTSGGGSTSLTVLCMQLLLGTSSVVLSTHATVVPAVGGTNIVVHGPQTVLTLTPTTATGWGGAGDSGAVLLNATGGQGKTWLVSLVGGVAGYEVGVYGSLDDALLSKSDGDLTVPQSSWFPITPRSLQGTGGGQNNPMNSSASAAVEVTCDQVLIAIRIVLLSITGTPSGNCLVKASATT